MSTAADGSARLEPQALAAFLADNFVEHDADGRLHVTARARQLAGAAFG